MITLNLLPPAKQQTIWRIQIFFAVADFLLGIFVISMLVAITTLCGRILLQSNLIKVVRDYNLISMTQPYRSREIKAVNSFIDQATQVQKQFKPSLTVINLIENNLIVGIQLKNIEITKEQIKLEALTNSRDIALAWQKQLNTVPGWEKIAIPFNDLLYLPPLNIKLILPNL